MNSGEPRGSPGRGTPGKIEFLAPRSPGKNLKNPRGKSDKKLTKIDSFLRQNVTFTVILFFFDNKEWKQGLRNDFQAVFVHFSNL